MMIKNNELSIIVYSCLKNKDMWRVFSILFKKYWSNCEYRLYLLTDFFEDEECEKYAFDEIISIDSNWSHMLKYALTITKTPYVMLFMDDYLLTDRVNNNDINCWLEECKKRQAINIRFVNGDFSRKTAISDELYIIESGSPYSLSTQAGIWNAHFLSAFIEDDWSPWDFERKGSILKGDLCILETRSYRFPYVEGVRKGKWMPVGIKVCKTNGIRLDFDKRSRMSVLDVAVMELKGFLLRLFPDLILRIQATINK